LHHGCGYAAAAPTIGYRPLLPGARPMPSFDVVSEVDKHELTNAVDQANRELATRFDFKGTDARFELEGYVVTQSALSPFQLKQMMDILRGSLSARGIDVRCMNAAEPLENLGGARQKITIRQGIEQRSEERRVGEGCRARRWAWRC